MKFTNLEQSLIALEMKRKKKAIISEFKFYLLMGLMFLIAAIVLWYVNNLSI